MSYCVTDNSKILSIIVLYNKNIYKYNITSGISRDAEAYIGEKLYLFIPKKALLANICPFNDKSMFSIKMLTSWHRHLCHIIFFI